MKEPSQKPFLDPFTFPAETDARFRLFFLSVLFLGIHTIYVFPNLSYGFVHDLWGKSYDAIRAEINPSLSNLSELLYNQIFTGSIVPFVLAIWVLALWLIIKYFYNKFNSNILKKTILATDTESLSERDTKKRLDALKAINSLAEKTGVAKFTLYTGNENRAVGSNDSPLLIINNNFLKRLFDPAVKAIILHEMGHIINKDIDKTIASGALWKSVKVLIFPILVLLILVNFGGGIIRRFPNGFDKQEVEHILFISTPSVLKELLSLLFIYVIFHLQYSSLLRVREFFADWRSARWGQKQSIVNAFGEESVASLSKLWNDRKSVIDFFKTVHKKYLEKYHPTIEQRKEALQDPSVLYKLDPQLSFLVGCCLALMLSVTEVYLLFNSYFLKITEYFISIFSAQSYILGKSIGYVAYSIISGCLVFVIFWVSRALFNTVGLQLFKSVISVISTGSKYPVKNLVKHAFLLTIGLEIGRILIPFNFNIIDITLSSVIILIVVNMIVFILLFFWLWFVQLLSIKLFKGAQSSINYRFRFVSIFSSIAMMGLFAVFSFLKTMVLMNPLEQPLMMASIAFVVGLSFLFLILTIAMILKTLLFRPLKICLKCNTTISSNHILGNHCHSCGVVFGDELWLLDK